MNAALPLTSAGVHLPWYSVDVASQSANNAFLESLLTRNKEHRPSVPFQHMLLRLYVDTIFKDILLALRDIVFPSYSSVCAIS